MLQPMASPQRLASVAQSAAGSIRRAIAMARRHSSRRWQGARFRPSTLESARGPARSGESRVVTIPRRRLSCPASIRSESGGLRDSVATGARPRARRSWRHWPAPLGKSTIAALHRERCTPACIGAGCSRLLAAEKYRTERPSYRLAAVSTEWGIAFVGAEGVPSVLVTADVKQPLQIHSSSSAGTESSTAHFPLTPKWVLSQPWTCRCRAVTDGKIPSAWAVVVQFCSGKHRFSVTQTLVSFRNSAPLYGRRLQPTYRLKNALDRV